MQIHFLFPDAIISKEGLESLIERAIQFSSAQAIVVPFFDHIIRPFSESVFDQFASMSELLLATISSFDVSIPTDLFSSTFRQNVYKLAKMAIGYQITSEMTDLLISKILVLLHQISLDLFMLLWQQLTAKQLKAVKFHEIDPFDSSCQFVADLSTISQLSTGNLSEFYLNLINSILNLGFDFEFVIWKKLYLREKSLVTAPIGRTLTYRETLSFLHLMAADTVLEHVIVASKAIQVPLELKFIGESLHGSIKVNSFGSLDKGIKFSVAIPAKISAHDINNNPMELDQSITSADYCFMIHNRIICAYGVDLSISAAKKFLQTTVVGNQSLISELLELNSSSIAFWDIDGLTLTTISDKPYSISQPDVPAFIQPDVDLLFQANAGVLIVSSHYILVPYVIHAGKLLCFPPIIFYNKWRNALNRPCLFVVSDGTRMLKINCRAILMEENLNVGWKRLLHEAGVMMNYSSMLPDSLSYYWKRSTLHLIPNHLEA